MSGIVGGNLGRGSGLIKAGTIDDNSVTLAKMAGLARGKLIYGDASGDPAALAVGGADEVLTHDGTDFDWAAAAGANTPSFHAYLSAQQDAPSTPYTAKCTFDTELWDTDGCYDNSTNYRFTPTTAGKYFIYTQIGLWTSGPDNCDYTGIAIQKNGTGVSSVSIDFRSQNIGWGNFLYGAVCVDMNGSSDYVEATGTVAWTTGTAEFKEGLQYTFFGGFKLI